MNTLLAFLWRLVVISAGYFAAVLTAGAVFTLALAALFDPGAQSGEPLDMLLEWAGFLVLVASIAGIVALLPAALLALLAEFFSWRGLTLHCALGAVLGACATLFWGSAQDPDRTVVMMAGATAGICGAFAYWLVAGRRAGLLLDRITASRQRDRA
jgi:hypothetical protein